MIADVWQQHYTPIGDSVGDGERHSMHKFNVQGCAVHLGICDRLERCWHRLDWPDDLTSLNSDFERQVLRDGAPVFHNKYSTACESGRHDLVPPSSLGTTPQ